MISNYLKIAWRNILRHKTFSLVTILGITIGMTTCLFILEYVSFKLSFDSFNQNANDIYRVVNDRYQQGKLIQHGTITYSAIGKALKDDYSAEVLENTRVEPGGTNIINYNNQKYEAEQIAVDNSFLTMFTYPMLAGDKRTALKEPNTVVLTRDLARSIFDLKTDDFQSVIGKDFKIDNGPNPYKVTGVCENVPKNSHLSFDFLMSYSSLYSGGNNGYTQADYDFQDSDFWHYIQLKPGVDYKAFQSKFDAFNQKHFQGNKVSGSDEKFYLQPLKEAHLYSDFEYEIGNTSNGRIVWGLFAIAIFIILIAWINYINLSTARAAERAKEVGVRKVVGSQRGQLIGQFLTESFCINFIALFFTFLLVLLLQSSYNKLLDLPLSLSVLYNSSLGGQYFLISLIGGFLFGIFISGYYPAFVLASFQPLVVLKGKFISSTRGIFLRKSLVVFQFTTTIFLIIGSLVVFRQLKFMNEKDLGLNIDQIISVQGPYLSSQDSSRVGRAEAFKQTVNRISHVKGVAFTDRPFGNEMARTFNVHRVGAGDDTKMTMRHYGVSADFLDVYKIKLIAGRNFVSTDYNYDYDKLHSLILNKKAVTQLGFKSPDDALGKAIFFNGHDWNVVGVVDDFHQKSLHSPVESLILKPTYGAGFPISVKVEAANVDETIAAVKKIYQSFFPQNIFNYEFLDQRFKQQYKDDQLLGNVILLFSGLIIFVACLGLFGLSLFIIGQRTKEIGVRKVLGASIPGIVSLLSKDFLKLVVVSIIIASPIAWYAMTQWLNDFTYHIDIEWWIFALAGIVALCIALFTVSYQAIKAALMNPIKSLKAE